MPSGKHNSIMIKITGAILSLSCSLSLTGANYHIFYTRTHIQAHHLRYAFKSASKISSFPFMG